jgi:hypothetical protein
MREVLLLATLSMGCHRRSSVSLDKSVWCAQAQQRLLFSPSGDSPAAALAARLGRPQTFLLGVGNDLDGEPPSSAKAYDLPVAIDLHYVYLTGLDGREGWTEWNRDARFVDHVLDEDSTRCIVSMFTLYTMAEEGEDRADVLTDDDYMEAWWSGLDRLIERLDEASSGPVIVHLEPDFWGFMQKRGAPEQIPAQVTAHQPECADLPNDLTGLGRCMVRRLHSVPDVVVGLHASSWAGSPSETAAYLSQTGGDEADLLIVETLDRDAGCFEVGLAPHCQRDDGPWYWQKEDFAEHLSWAGELHAASGKPLLWWQMPLGVPQHRPGRAGAYRDNRVEFVLKYPEDFAAAGGIGAVFGKGARDQTDIDTDGGQLRRGLRRYYQEPTALP